jgi:hypothetical protein
MICQVCSKEFEAKRSTAKFCSPKCRVTASRGVTVTTEPLSVTNSVTESVSVTPNRNAKKVLADTLKKLEGQVFVAQSDDVHGFTAEGTPTVNGKVFNHRLNKWVEPGVCKFGECHAPDCRLRKVMA